MGVRKKQLKFAVVDVIVVVVLWRVQQERAVAQLRHVRLFTGVEEMAKKGCY